jgi:hypothetical protein
VPGPFDRSSFAWAATGRSSTRAGLANEIFDAYSLFEALELLRLLTELRRNPDDAKKSWSGKIANPYAPDAAFTTAVVIDNPGLTACPRP